MMRDMKFSRLKVSEVDGNLEDLHVRLIGIGSQKTTRVEVGALHP